MSTDLLVPEHKARIPVTSGGKAWRALLLSETRRLVFHPAVVAALVLVSANFFLPLALNPDSGAFADMTAASWQDQYTILILAGGTFMAISLNALRPRRFATVEFENVLALPQWQRAAATGISCTAPAMLALLLAALHLTVLAHLPGAAGQVRVGELLAGACCVYLAGNLGLLAAVALRNVIASLLGMFFLAVVAFLGLLATSSRVRWMSFIAGENPFDTPPMPQQFVDRPQWWHLAWLVGLAGTALCTSLALTGAGRKITALGAAIAATVAVAAVPGQMSTSDGLAARLDAARRGPASLQVCEDRNAVSYCAFPDFRSRIPAWAEIVDSQLGVLPSGVSRPRFGVRQHLPLPAGEHGVSSRLPLSTWAAQDAAAGMSPNVPVSTRWSAGGTDSFNESEVLGFSALVAAKLVSGGADPGSTSAVCGAKGALVLWMAAGATPGTRKSLETVLSHTSGAILGLPVLNSSTGVRVGSRELALALSMLKADRVAMRDKVTDHWQDLTNDTTTVDRAAADLGLAAPTATNAPEEGLCS